MIPIELFFIANVLMDYYLLYLSLRWLDARMIHVPRLLLAAAFGGLYACAAYGFAGWLLIPPIPLLMAAPMVRISLGRAPVKTILKGAGFMLTAAFLSGGTIFAIRQAFPGASYAPFMLAGAAIAGISSLALGRNKRRAAWVKGEVQYRYKDTAGRFDAAVDSGNHAVDPVSGLPVIVAPADTVARYFSVKEIHELRALPEGFRLMALSTVAGTKLAPVFTPDIVTWNGKPVRAAIALATSGKLTIALAPSCFTSTDAAIIGEASQKERSVS